MTTIPKETIIQEIRQRILDEHRKHSTALDWSWLAAKKIYESYIAIDPLPIKNVVVDKGTTLWLIEEATDLETAQAAISFAMVTGSVGATEEHKNAEVPHGDGKLLKYAKVVRIEKVKPL